VAKRKVLIVDDKISVAKELEGRLSRLGYDVAAIASSGNHAMTMTIDAPPDLVLMDVLPGDEAKCTDAVDALRRRWEIPAVFMIAENHEATLRKAGVAEPFRYVVKPFTERELSVNIELALCKHDAEKAVDDLEDRFFAASVDMLCYLDFSGHFKRLNPAWERTLGYKLEELMSRPFIEFVHPDDRERTLQQNAQVRAGGQALGFENRYICKDGTYRWFHWNAAPDIGQRVIYSVARDITARKLGEDERDRLVTELKAALAEVRTLRQILPICSYCKKIRDDENYWHTVEGYISRHTSTRFTHGVCPSCLATQLDQPLTRNE
jgi:PAS domain S-box-containing protein